MSKKKRKHAKMVAARLAKVEADLAALKGSPPPAEDGVLQKIQIGSDRKPDPI